MAALVDAIKHDLRLRVSSHIPLVVRLASLFHAEFGHGPSGEPASAKLRKTVLPQPFSLLGRVGRGIGQKAA